MISSTPQGGGTMQTLSVPHTANSVQTTMLEPQYVQHDRIEIVGDTALLQMAQSEGWQGSGRAVRIAFSTVMISSIILLALEVIDIQKAIYWLSVLFFSVIRWNSFHNC